MRLVLASGSPTRQKLLHDAGVRFAVIPARVDEESVVATLVADGISARDGAAVLAELKAVQVSKAHPQDLVIGADQILSEGGRYFQKPGDVNEARAQLIQLRGKKHVLSSAVCAAVDGAMIWKHVADAQLWMRIFSDEFLETYIGECGVEILGSVGGYLVERQGIQLFDRIEGEHSTILGLPMLPLLGFLRLQKMVAM